MLTQNDLQAIKKVVDKSIDDRIAPVEKNVTGLGQKVGSLDQKVTSLDEKVTGLDQKVDRLEKKMDEGFKKSHQMDNDILGCLDKEDYKLKIRVDRIERHLGMAAFA